MNDPAYVQYKHNTAVTRAGLKIGRITLIQEQTQLTWPDNFLYNPQFHTDPFSGSTAVTCT